VPIQRFANSNPLAFKFIHDSPELWDRRIAVLGWGSLISNPDGDASIGQRPLKIAGKFCPGGPFLPLEFSRISKDGRLTLVIDSAHGTPCETFYAICATPNLNDAIQNLAAREGMSIQQVHFAVGGGDYSDSIRRGISEWLIRNQLSKAIWTGLPPKFSFQNVAEFSTEAAIEYLKSLTGVMRQKAFNYIAAAPATIKTPVRAMANELFGL
jgi:hypothetical protein